MGRKCAQMLIFSQSSMTVFIHSIWIYLGFGLFDHIIKLKELLTSILHLDQTIHLLNKNIVCEVISYENDH